MPPLSQRLSTIKEECFLVLIHAKCRRESFQTPSSSNAVGIIGQ